MSLVPNDYANVNSSRGVAIHELSHVLGFGSFFYDKFFNKSYSQVVSNFGFNSSKIISPKVVEWVKNFKNDFKKTK